MKLFLSCLRPFDKAVSLAPLPQTRAFATRLGVHLPLLPPPPPPVINTLEDDLRFVINYDGGYNPPRSDPSACPSTLSGSTDSWSAYPGSSQCSTSSSFPTPPSWTPQEDTNEGSDFVLFPCTASPKGISTTLDCHQQPNSAAFSPIPPYPHGTPTSGVSSQVFIESMRVLLRSYGYEIVPLSG